MMARSSTQSLVVTVCLGCVFCASGVAAQDRGRESTALEGLWSGSWGGGAAGDVIFQPVLAELVIEGHHLEMSGFRNAPRLRGAVRIDADARRMQVVPAIAAGDASPPQALVYSYTLKADELTLTDGEGVSTVLKRQLVVQDPRANVQVELVAATGINDAGDLLVTEFTVLQTGGRGAYFQPQPRTLNTRQAAIFQVQQTSLKKITVDEARGLLREATPVAVAFRSADPPPQSHHELWSAVGPPMPDSPAVARTLHRMLRPGALVFVFPASEQLPLP